MRLSYKALSLFRVVLAFALSDEWIHRWRERHDFILGERIRFAHFDFNGFGLFDLCSTNWQLDLVMLFGAALILLWGWGYRTRWTQPLLLLFYIGLIQRTAATINAGDVIAASLLFWTLFLPVDHHYSWAKRNSREDPRSPNGLAALGLVSQIAIIYFFSALSKTGSSWSSLDALYYFWNLSMSTDASRALSQLLPSNVIHGMSLGSLIVEFCAPILIFSPWRVIQCRQIAVFLLVSLHLGIECSFYTGSFQWIAIAGACALYPFSDLSPARPLLPYAGSLGSEEIAPMRFLKRIALAAIIFCMWWQAIFNASRSSSLDWASPSVPSPPALFQSASDYTLIQQVWQMYAPEPSPWIRWWVVIARDTSGRRWDLLRGTPESPAIGAELPANIGGLESRYWTRLMVMHMGSLNDTQVFSSALDHFEKKLPDSLPVVSLEIDVFERKIGAPNVGRLEYGPVYQFLKRTYPDRKLLGPRVLQGYPWVTLSGGTL